MAMYRKEPLDGALYGIVRTLIVGVSSYLSSLICMSTLPLGVSVSTKPDPGNLPSWHCHGPLKKARPNHALHFAIN